MPGHSGNFAWLWPFISCFLRNRNFSGRAALCCVSRVVARGTSRLSVETEVGQAGARVGTERQKSGLLINLDVDCCIGQFIFTGSQRMSVLGVSSA